MSEPKKLNIQYPYGGVRFSWFTYHPREHGPVDMDGQWEMTARRFMGIFESFCDVTDLYTDQQTHSEVVGGPAWKKDVLKLFRAIEMEKGIYQLEALAEQLFDVDNKSKQREFPYHSEIKERALILRAEDSTIQGASADRLPKGTRIIQRGWGA